MIGPREAIGNPDGGRTFFVRNRSYEPYESHKPHTTLSLVATPLRAAVQSCLPAGERATIAAALGLAAPVGVA